jgi:dephospho-CoA kinase
MPEPVARPPRRPPVIGLAGAIGAGKSTVAGILGEAGCLVSDADRLAREVLAESDVVAELVSWWGSGVLDADGRPDRKAIAEIVFADPEARQRLEDLVHPRVHAARAAAFASAPPNTPALVIDAPLLFEAGLAEACDAVVFVDAPRKTRIERVARRGWDAAELDRREAAQWPLDRKRASADHVLVNDADLASLRTQVLEQLGRILSRPDESSSSSA